MFKCFKEYRNNKILNLISPIFLFLITFYNSSTPPSLSRHGFKVVSVKTVVTSGISSSITYILKWHVIMYPSVKLHFPSIPID